AGTPMRLDDVPLPKRRSGTGFDALRRRPRCSESHALRRSAARAQALHRARRTTLSRTPDASMTLHEAAMNSSIEARTPSYRRSSPLRADTQVNGRAFRTSVACFVDVFGSVSRLLDVCPSDLRDAIHYHKIVAGGWHPIEWYRQLLHALALASG